MNSATLLRGPRVVLDGLARMTLPLVLQLDFREARTAADATRARTWLLLAVAADLAAQYLVGTPTLLSVAFSLCTLSLTRAPSRLAATFGAMFVTQALVSIGIVLALAPLGSEHLIEVATSTWAVWCMAAAAGLALRYIRTPKREMKS